MLDLSLLRTNPEKIKYALEKKCVDLDFEKLVELDNSRRALIEEVDEMRAQQNQFNKKITELDEASKQQSLTDIKTLSADLQIKVKELDKISQEFNALWFQVPNISAEDVPEGCTDADNREIKTYGRTPSYDFEPKSHEDLMRKLDLADLDRATKVAGNKFYYLKGRGVILEMALLRMAMDLLVEKGFTPLTTPDLVRPEVMYGAAHFPPEDDAYGLERDGLFLAGTAEVGLAGYHKDELLNESELPLKYAGASVCFRREAGSYGKKGSGLYRVHQFNKIEMYELCRPEESEAEHQKLLEVSEELMQKLELPYRVVLNCGGDLGLPQYKKYDIEAWIPSMNDWGETHSCSNDTDYQARRLNIKYQKTDGTKEYVHTLNNTAIASPRIILPLLEIHQQSDGSIRLPEALVKYTGFDVLK